MAFQYKKRSQADVEARANQQGGNFQGFIKDEYEMYTVKKGDNAVRFLPATWEDAQHYGIDIFVHYSVGPEKATVLCPLKMEKKPCPLCEELLRAERRSDEDMVKELKPTKRVLTWILDRKESEKGPLAWALAWTLDREIAKHSRDRESGEYYFIDSPDEGYDVYFDKEGEMERTKYTGVQLARRPTSVDEVHLNFIQNNQLPDILIWRDYDEIKELFEGGKSDPPVEAKTDPSPKPNGSAGRVALKRELEPEANDDPPFEGGKRVEDDTPPPPKASERPKEEAVSGASRAASLRERFARR